MNINNSIIINSSGISSILNWVSSYYEGVAEKNKELAQFLAPTVPQPTATAFYTQYDRLSAFELQETLVCPIKGFEESNPKGTNLNVNLEQHGSSSRIMAIQKLNSVPDGNTVAGDMVMRSHASVCANKMSMSILNDVKSMLDGLPATAAPWREVDTATPIADMREMVKIFVILNGNRPNRMLLSQEALDIIQATDECQILLGEYGVKSLTKDRLKALLNYGEDDDLTIKVETIPFNRGNGEENKDMFADRVYMFYAQDTPMPEDRTAIRTFLYTGSELLGTMTLEMRESDKSEKLSLMNFRKVVATAPDAFQQFVIQPKA